MFLALTAQQNNLITIALVAVLVLVVIIAVIRKAAANKKAAIAPAPVSNATTTVAAPVKKPTAPGSAGQLKLYNVEPKTAAMIMAIVADKMGKPLNELRFISIKEVK